MEYRKLRAEIEKLVCANELSDLKKLQTEPYFALALVDGGSDHVSAPLNVLVETILNYYGSGFTQYEEMIRFLIENHANTEGLIFQVQESAHGMDVSGLIGFLEELGVPNTDIFIEDGIVTHEGNDTALAGSYFEHAHTAAATGFSS